jgi:hypothetical protein
MSKLSIKEKEYAISRACSIINARYSNKIKKAKTVSDNEVYKVLGYLPKDFNNLSSYNTASKAKEYHPAYKKLREQNKAIGMANDKVKALAELEKQAAKDFIMLGDREEVFEYIKNLGK